MNNNQPQKLSDIYKSLNKTQIEKILNQNLSKEDAEKIISYINTLEDRLNSMLEKKIYYIESYKKPIADREF